MLSATTALRAVTRRTLTPRRAAMTMKEGATTVVVTGASRGIGAAIAKDLGAQGCNVVVNYAASEGPALEVVEAIKASGGDAIAIKANMAELDDIKAMFKQVAAEFGGCDVLVNNAGITKDGLAMRMKPAQWQDVIDVNLSGVFYCSQQAFNQMAKKSKGRIINMSSVVGLFGNPGQANYASAKGGVCAVYHVERQGVRRARRHGERRLPGLHWDGDGQRVRRGHAREGEERHPAGAPGRRRGGRGPRAVPGARRVGGLHHGPLAHHRRRHRDRRGLLGGARG